MPRRPRLALAGYPLHITQRGNNRSECFFSDDDRLEYLHWLRHYCHALGVRLHAYVLMSNHVHLLLTPAHPEGASRLMQSLGRRYVRAINDTYQRTGTLWEGRFHACAVHAEAYLLSCMRYIELNPVRADLARSPEDYRWSSFRRNGMGESSRLIAEHPVYARLGANAEDRRIAYAGLFAADVDDRVVAEIRKATFAGHLLAHPDYRRDAESMLNLTLGPARRGRPREKLGSESS